MQKSVLVPIEKYERLIAKYKDSEESRSLPIKGRCGNSVEGEKSEHPEKSPQHEVETKDSSTQTLPEESSSNSQESSSVADRLPQTDSPQVRKKRMRLPPPGLRNWKSLWVKIDGRL